MKKKALSLVLSVIMLFACVSPAMAAESTNGSGATITIYFNQNKPMAMSGENVDTGFEATEVKAFFEDQDMNYDYYRNWLYEQELSGLESVTITVLPSDRRTGLASASAIQGHRLVYADRNYRYDPKTNKFTPGELIKNAVSESITVCIGKYSQIIASLASVLNITDPDTYFGTDRVREGKEYYVNDGANRVVTKFVELYAPVLGKTQWYAWGYAEGDYVRHGVQLYYKGLEEGPKENVYHQYYTENYYREATLVSLVKEAYSNGRDYGEVADDYAAAVGGYKLYDRDITREKYLEYDDKVIN